MSEEKNITISSEELKNAFESIEKEYKEVESLIAKLKDQLAKMELRKQQIVGKALLYNELEAGNFKPDAGKKVVKLPEGTGEESNDKTDK